MFTSVQYLYPSIIQMLHQKKLLPAAKSGTHIHSDANTNVCLFGEEQVCAKGDISSGAKSNIEMEHPYLSIHISVFNI